ncbi:hypothetical protein F5Y12DRAFT_773165 [Xylaria sp. FL1777]|nr:hypothetical protein F5Y12DRAFT_773165 [Xylaria sp. FL1777]
MANLKTTLARLLDSGEFSDLTLVCEGQEFLVHKSIVCSQSPVINTALKSEFTEAKTNTMEVDFDIETLKCMLDYMYKADYKEQPAKLTQPSQGVNQASPASPTITEILLYHARVNGIADYYGVAGLTTLSADRIYKVLKKDWSADAFCYLVRDVEGLTGDKDLRQRLTQFAASHVFELIGKEVFSEGKVANNMAAEVLKAANQMYANSFSQQKKLEAETRAKQETINRLQENLKEITDVLSKKSCCNCKKTFGGEIEPPSQNLEKRWLVRCASCGCRHAYDRTKDRVIVAPCPPRK